MREWIRKVDQVQGNVFAGRLRSNKPVTGGRLSNGRRTSSIFYWSHSIAEGECEFGLHGHEGFEILTFVLRGENAHYDTVSRTWTPLREGDFQIISSGSGLQHGERLRAGTEAFQLWFDPDLRRAVSEPPAYADYTSGSLDPVVDGGTEITHVIGGRSVARATTPGLVVRRVRFTRPGTTVLPLGDGKFALAYARSGTPMIDGLALATDDVVCAAGGALSIAHDDRVELFVVEVPENPGYSPAHEG
jgi:redox-sensitive bicupin YhaK (pirin superfamily)